MKNAATQSLNFQPDKWDQQMRAKQLFFIVLIAHIHLLRIEYPDAGAFKTDLHRAQVRWNNLKMKCLEGCYIVWLTAQNEQKLLTVEKILTSELYNLLFKIVFFTWKKLVRYQISCKTLLKLSCQVIVVYLSINTVLLCVHLVTGFAWMLSLPWQ